MSNSNKTRNSSKHSANSSKKSKKSKNGKPKTPLLMDRAAENMENYSPSPYNFTEQYVPNIDYTHTENDEYDGIVFLIGHSEFKGDLCRIQTIEGMKHHTLLVANIGNSCIWFTQPQLFESFIRNRFSNALSYLSTDIEDFIQTLKNKFEKNPGMEAKIKTSQRYQGFFGSKPKHSTAPTEFCEREWQFYTQDKEEKPDGRVMLLRRNKKGQPYFTVLYKQQIKQGKFSLMKSELYKKLYSIYHLRNILLVDFGCTNTRGVDAFNRQWLDRGFFGGAS